MTDDLTMWSLLVGFFLPLLVSVLQQPRWTNGLRAAVSALAAVAAGAGTAYFQGELTDGRSLVSAILVVLVTSLALYKSFWKPTGVSPSIEHATSSSSRPTGDVGTAWLHIVLIALGILFVIFVLVPAVVR